jgi:hypothetical protein
MVREAQRWGRREREAKAVSERRDAEGVEDRAQNGR